MYVNAIRRVGYNGVLLNINIQDTCCKYLSPFVNSLYDYSRVSLFLN